VNRLAEQVEGEICERKLFCKGESILVAVSGGLDSMVLLHVLHFLAPNHGWRVAVAHFNHQLRGAASDHDQELVKQTASKWNLPFQTQSADVKAYALEAGLSVEMAARQLRHAFFAASAQKVGSKTVVLAHHADDQVELFFLRVLRGTSTQGLAGMRWASPSPADSLIRLVRPLLAQSKNDLAAYAAAEKIAFSEDATNVHLDIPRNRIRHELIPLLEKHYQPALTKTTLRLMELAGAEADFVSESVEKLPATASFSDLPLALQRRRLQHQLLSLKLPVDFELIEQLRLFPDSAVSVGPDQSVVRDLKGHIYVQTSNPVQFVQNCCHFHLDSPSGHNKIEFEGLKIVWSITGETHGQLDQMPKREYFDADKVGKTIQLRYWQRGDRFQPIGAGSECKLQDLFTNLKIAQRERHQRIVAVSEKERIFWVEGLRIGECFKLDKQTVRWLNWEWQR
jgi:tRNA(Ile)-lysidine synthase